MTIVPTLLAATSAEAEARLSGLGSIEELHVDFADGTFVPASLLSVEAVDDLVRVPFEAHLMVAEPERYMDNLFAIPLCRSIVVHAETAAISDYTVQRANRSGRLLGLALRPETAIPDALPTWVNRLVLLGVEPGRSGQPYHAATVGRMTMVAERFGRIEREVDGGMTEETAGAVVAAGATRLAVGSYFDGVTYADGVERLRRVIG